MSATNRNPLRPRVPHDEYRTPLGTIAAMLDVINWQVIDTVLDPCAGDGRITREALFRKPSLKVEHCEIRKGKDYLKQEYPPLPMPFDLVITNPPFSLAQEITTKALEDGHVVVMLQRLNWLASQTRRDWWRENEPSHVFVLSQRPCFIHVCTGCGASYHPDDAVTQCSHCGGKVRPGTDATDYAWFAWTLLDGMFMVPRGVHHL